jgi:uncharacterized protein HemY
MTLFDDVLPCTLPFGGALLVLLLLGQFSQMELRKLRESGRALHRRVPGLPPQELPASKPDKISWKRFISLLVCIIALWVLLAGVGTLVVSDKIGQEDWQATLTILAILISFVPLFPVTFYHLPAFSRASYVKDHPSFWCALAKGIGALVGWIVFTIISGIIIFWLGSLIENKVLSTLAILAIGFVAIIVVTLGAIWLPTRWIDGALCRADYDTALRRIQLLHRFRPRSPHLLFIHGTVLLFAGRHAEAEKSLRDSLVKAQNNTAFASSQSETLENLGYALLEQQRYGESIQAFEGSIEINPESAGPYSGLAEVYLRQGIRPERALELMEKALEHKLRSYLARCTDQQRLGEMWGNHAWALAMLGRHTKASESLEHAFGEVSEKHKPRLAEVCYRAGQAMRLRGAKVAATEYFERACEMDPQGNAGSLAARALAEEVSQKGQSSER